MIVKPDKPRAPKSSKGPMSARVLIIEGRFYEEIGNELIAGAEAALDEAGVAYDRITVPGALEIPQALQQAVASGLIPGRAAGGKWDGAVALGCVIRGETYHFEIVCNNANHWLMKIATEHSVPVGNGILTVENEEQALARARGGISSKGADAARACLRLIELQREFEGQNV